MIKIIRGGQLMKIVFMGTPDFALESLKSLYEANNEIIGVVTNLTL